MKKEELQVLQDITKIQDRQRLLLQKPKNAQQELLQIYGQRFLLSKKMLHRNIEAVLQYLPGTFGATALRLSYMGVCLDNSVELPLDQYPVLKMLVDWSDFLHSPESNELTLNELVFQNKEPIIFTSHEEYTSYLNLIANDLLKWFKNKQLSNDDILSFIHAALPKVLYNILLPKHLVPSIASDKGNVEILYKHRSWEHFHRSKPSLGTLLKFLLFQVVGRDLRDGEQKKTMELILRYFFIYHYDKKYQATDLFIQGFNILNRNVRTALSDELILFFRMARKIGKNKFVDFLTNKSEWLKEILEKVDDSKLVGYPKDVLTPYNNAGLSELVQVSRSKTESRFLEVVQDLSMVYFSIQALSLDITIRLFYLGSMEGRPSNTLLNQQIKVSGEYRSNFLALKRGIYKFQLDNSYSWINGKTIRFEYTVLQPMQIKSNQPNTWSHGYYGSLPTNQLSKPYVVKVIQMSSGNAQERLGDGKAAITKNGRFFNVKVNKPGHVYQFQTQNQDKFVKRCIDISNQNEGLAWTLFGEVLSDSRELGAQLGGERSLKEKPAMKQEKKAEQIDANFQDEEDEEKE